MFESDNERQERERLERILRREEYLALVASLFDTIKDVGKTITVADEIITHVNDRHPLTDH